MRCVLMLQRMVSSLKNAGIESARLDSLILLEDATGKDRSWLLAHPEYLLQGHTLQKLERQLERRIAHEPIAYILGRTEFYGREFVINHDVLEPRPESETMITLLRDVVASRQSPVARVIDVGTGSGALATTTKLELPNLDVLATDIDSKCLAVAQKNADKLGAKVTFLEGDLLSPVTLSADEWRQAIILANLPYVPDTWQINSAAMHEPRLAIFGGPDGLDLYRRLFMQIDALPAKPATILTESLPPQHEALHKLAAKHHYELRGTVDFIQYFA